MRHDILNLPGYRVLHVDDSGPDYHIRAETIAPPATCIHCGATALVRYGRREQLIHDLPIHGKRVGISVDTRRYRCKGCRKTFYEPLPAMDEKRRMTTRLANWLGEHSARKTFTQLAEETGVSNMTVKAVFEDHSAKLGAALKIETPEFMGIDEIHLIRRPRAVFTNTKGSHHAGGCLVIEMLANRDKKSVVRYLSGLPDRERIRCVTIDMWRPYRDAVREVLPNASVVVDKFHTLKMANAALDQVRKSVGAVMTSRQRRTLMKDRKALLMRPKDLGLEGTIKLSGWLRNLPELEAAYNAKETFYALYDAGSKEEALHLQERWKSSLAPEIKAAYQPLITAFRNWREEILAYFDWRLTNACAESVNNLIRVANRMGRGYSFEVLRSRILLTNHAGHKKKKLYARPKREDTQQMVHHYALPSTPEEIGEISEGVDISTLLRLAEDGLL
ncbi:MAG: ISL3 family transposase [Acidithiobacillus sp.]